MRWPSALTAIPISRWTPPPASPTSSFNLATRFGLSCSSIRTAFFTQPTWLSCRKTTQRKLCSSGQVPTSEIGSSLPRTRPSSTKDTPPGGSGCRSRSCASSIATTPFVGFQVLWARFGYRTNWGCGAVASPAAPKELENRSGSRFCPLPSANCLLPTALQQPPRQVEAPGLLRNLQEAGDVHEAEASE